MRILWADLAKAHRDLIATKALDDGPFLTRLWYHHLFWLCSFLKSAVTIKASGIGFLVRRQCYRAADRLFGGTREEAYCEKLNRNAETLRGRVEQLKTQQQERAEEGETGAPQERMGHPPVVHEAEDGAAEREEKIQIR